MAPVLRRLLRCYSAIQRFMFVWAHARERNDLVSASSCCPARHSGGRFQLNSRVGLCSAAGKKRMSRFFSPLHDDPIYERTRHVRRPQI